MHVLDMSLTEYARDSTPGYKLAELNRDLEEVTTLLSMLTLNETEPPKNQDHHRIFLNIEKKK